ncbi:DUF6879 family protein [Streptomyces dangxiongensis]|uniref:DUF6879 family protein n=1 Tax=Streptomyces dangxiongensis TaxID=1442032 RepID=UPI003741F913
MTARRPPAEPSSSRPAPGRPSCPGSNANARSADGSLANTHHSAVHLEMRDPYGIGEEAAEVGRWCSGWRPDPDPATWWNDFHTWAVTRRPEGWCSAGPTSCRSR